MIALALLPLAAAAPPVWSVGVLGAVATDLPDTSFDDPSARYALGGGLIVPVRWSPRPGAAVRVTVTALGAGGHDTVAWVEDGVALESRDHWSMLSVGQITVGGEFEFAPSALVTPLVGAGLGGGVVANFHSFGGDTQALLDPSQNELDNPQNVDPYTLGAVPAAEAWAGLRVGRTVAFAVEAGYTLSFVPAETLQKTPAELGARRSAYALDLLRVAVGLSVPL